MGVSPLARKNKNESSGLEQAGNFHPARLRPVDVQQVEFRVSRKGYNETEVDEFLDRVTEELVALNEENKRLKESAGLAGIGIGQTPEEAQDLIRAAREEADAIVAAARATAAGVGAVASGDPMAAVYPFLTKEREFLSALGEMVRTHMEGIKTDARALQEAAKASTPAPPPAPEAPPSAPAPAAIEAEAAAASSAWAATAEAEAPVAEPAPTPEPDAKVEPAPEPAAPAGDVASIPHTEVDTPKKADEEPSLRDLFWGDE